MKLNIVNLTGSTKTYLSGTVSVVGNGSTAITNLTQQLSLSTDGQLISDLFSNFVQLTDGVNTFASNDAIEYLKSIRQSNQPILDSKGNPFDSINQVSGLSTGNTFLASSINQYIFASTNNSSTSNIASNASFTGTADIAISQASIDINFFSDQACTIQVQQSSDSTHWDIIDTYYTYASIGDGRTFNSITLYWRIVVTNTGTSTTTAFRLQSGLIPIANPLPRALTQAGNLQVTSTETSPFGPNATQLFDDTFDTGLEVVNRWNAPISSGGGTSVTNTPGSVILGTGTTANGYTVLSSQMNFPQLSPGWLIYYNAINLEFPIITNTYRFWGLGTSPSTPTTTAPLTDAVGFEITTTGKLVAVTYSSGTRNIIQDLSSTGNSTQPNDNKVHKYYVYFRGDKAFWCIDEVSNQVAVMRTGAAGPTVNSLPLKMLAIANSSVPLSSGLLTSNAVFVGDSSSGSIQLSDGTFAWRKVTVKAASTASIASDTSLVVTLSPNSPLPAGSANIGTVKAQLQDNSGNAINSNNNQLQVRDVLNTSSQYRAQSVTTSASEALGGASILVNRKLISITPTNGIIYWGGSNAVTTTTGQPLFPNNTLFLSVTDNNHVYLIAGTTTDVRITEFS